jgi:hypothetical protein
MQPTKQLPVRLPATLHDELRQEAERQHMSMNTLVVRTLIAAIPTDECPTCGGTGKTQPIAPFGDWQHQVGS